MAIKHVKSIKAADLEKLVGDVVLAVLFDGDPECADVPDIRICPDDPELVLINGELHRIESKAKR